MFAIAAKHLIDDEMHMASITILKIDDALKSPLMINALLARLANARTRTKLIPMTDNRIVACAFQELPDKFATAVGRINKIYPTMKHIYAACIYKSTSQDKILLKFVVNLNSGRGF